MKKRSDRLETYDVVNYAGFCYAYWSPAAPDTAIVSINGDISTRGDVKAAGDPKRAKRWYEVIELRRDGNGLFVRMKALTDSYARDARGEMLDFLIPNGCLIDFNYRGKMTEDGTQIVYTIPPIHPT